MPGSILVGAAYGSATIGSTAATAAAIASLGQVGYAAAVFAVNFAISSVVTRIFAPNAQGGSDNGTRQQIPPSANNPIPVAYGDAWLGGTFVDAVLTEDQKTMYYVLAISHVSPNGTFTFDTNNFYYGDQKVTFDTTDLTMVKSLTDGAGNIDGEIRDNLFIYLYTSNAAGVITPHNSSVAPSTLMGGVDIPVDLRWPSTGRQMNGLAFAIVKLRYSTNDQVTGLQPITFKVNQKLFAASVARPGDVLYDYLTNDVYGGAVAPANVNWDACEALNLYSDGLISYTPAAGGTATKARYRINGVVNTGEKVLSNVDKLLVACDSWLSYGAATGQWTPVINKAETASFAFDDSNIIGDIRVSVTDIASSYNEIEASFPNKTNKDQPEYVRMATPDALRYPNEPDNKLSTTFDFVNDSVQAQYLANRILEQAREDLIVAFSTAYTGIQCNAGDVVSVTNAEYGWSAKLFRVMKVRESTLMDGNLGASFELSEYNAAVFDDASIVEYQPAGNSDFASPSYFSALSAPTVGDIQTTTSVPSFSVSCVIPAVGRSLAITLFYTTSATPSSTDWKIWGSLALANQEPFTPGSTIKFPDISLPAGSYYFSFRVANNIGASPISPASTVLNWLPAATVGVREGTAVVYQWAVTEPAISGTSTFDWSTGEVTSAPTNWRTTISDAPGATSTLWVAEVPVSDSVVNSTTSVVWTSATPVPLGFVANTGAIPRIAYSKTTAALSKVPSTITTTGSTSFPANGSWGTGTVWSDTLPTVVAGESIWQAEGVYNPGTGNTIWGYPYISSLRVGNLSAVSTQTGSLDVTGSITVGASGNIKGGQTDFNTGTGFFLGYSSAAYKFSIGTATKNMLWDGSDLTINGGAIQTAASGQRIVINGSSDNKLRFYSSAGTLSAEIGGTSGLIWATSPGSLFSTIVGKSSGTFSGIYGENTSSGAGGEFLSSSGYGATFSGNATKGNIFLNPVTNLPSSRTAGSVCFYNGWLCFANGTHWFQSNGTQLT